MRLTFWGAAKQVTGSMFLLECENDYNILIDCGTDLSKEFRSGERPVYPESGSTIFPFDPSRVNVVILTHAHIDHSGNIPNLVREGFEGQVLCTAATLDLSKLLLQDAAILHRKKLNAIYGGKRKPNGPQVDVSELYMENHVTDAMEAFVAIAFNRRFKLAKGLWVTFIETGHLLGAANVLIEQEVDGEWKRIGFSGDLGRSNYPLLRDPEPFPEVDYLVTESTYGNRNHIDQGNPIDILADVIQEACVDKPGRLIIPAFSVGRTQALLYTLNRLYTERNFPDIQVFADSPLAIASTRVYDKHKSLLNEEATEFFEDYGSLFDFKNLTVIDNTKDSQAISNYNRPCIILSSSGMINGGRIENHIKVNIGNPYCTILMVGYAPEGTVGYELIHNTGYLRINSDKLEVNATIKRTDIFSGHGDRDDLLTFARYQKPEKLKKLFLVHGDEDSLLAYKEVLNNEGFTQAVIPGKGERFEL